MQFLKSLERALAVALGNLKPLKLHPDRASKERNEFFRRCLFVISASRLRESIVQWLVHHPTDPSVLKEMHFFEDLMDISGDALAVPPGLRREFLIQEVARICSNRCLPVTHWQSDSNVPQDSFSRFADPFEGDLTLVGIDASGCRPLKSASKV
eukprot:Gregarina_sp_Poly_1__6039@NODE_3186_length_1291_cov_227_401144_g2023_i0_p2_GENE_NODE_3186_length_1291_cov_227_401144_g2023_i0NODE_3186_length_1291_cov_227_401144_g2023_i0_p2_ORF_typecomplete_len154_score25_60_NODE_3186_length_1291_cov_227_401144_g2023_i06861147